MKNRFRLFAILIALFMCLNMLPIAAFAAAFTVTVTNGKLDNDQASGSFDEGTSVAIVADTIENKRFTGWTGLDNVDITEGNVSTAAVKFTMPAQAVNATATYEVIPAATYTVTVTNDGHGTGIVNPTSGIEGVQVALDAAPNENYKFKEWQIISGGGALGNASAAATTFTIGTANAEVKAFFEEITYVVTVNSTTHGKVSVDKTNAPKDGNVSITITPDNGYELDSLSVKDPANNEISVNKNVFKMPACNVTVTATFKAAPAKSVTYSITGGANGYWIKGTGLYYTITAKRSTADSECINHFTGVMIDNNILPITDYTIKSGSTVVTIKPYALQRLSVGVHTVSLWFDDGIASTFIYIWADPRYPATGDERQTATWAALTGVTFVGMAAVVVLGRMYWKKQKNK